VTQQAASKKMFYLMTAAMTLFCSEVSANASAENAHELSDICMYSQRILKDYALIGMNVTYHDPKKDLEENIKIVDKYFKNIESHKLNDKLMAEVVEVQKTWSELKPEFEKAPDKAKMSSLHEKVEKYTDRCEQVADKLADDTGIKGEHYVELVGELGMESQRMAALYLMKAWGIDVDSAKDVKAVSDETNKTYSELLNADEKLVSKEIKEKLKATENDFVAFEVLTASTSGRFMPMQAEKSSSKIFEAVRSILTMEEKLVEAVSGYFRPVADERKAIEAVNELTEALHVEEHVKS
jgi:hypothetical protein